MPFYAYECKECGEKLEDVQQSIKEEPLKICPECNNPKLERVIARTHFVLQGGGWAKDKYSSSKSSK